MQGLGVNLGVIKYVLIHALVDNEVQRFCVRSLKPEHFILPEEKPYAVLWRVFLDYFEDYGRAPDLTTLNVFLSSRLQQAHVAPEIILDHLEEIFQIAETVTPEELNREAALELAKIIIARYFKDTMHERLNRMNGDDTAFASFLDEIYSQFKTSTRFSSYSVEPDAPELTSLVEEFETTPYRINFIDSVMGGGCRENEVYCLLGPTGGGKSLLGLQLVTEQATHFYVENINSINVYFTYELCKRDTLVRAYAQTTSIPLERLEQIARQEDHFTEDERRRYNIAREVLRNCYRIVDFSGSDPSTSDTANGGDLYEVVDYLMKLQDTTGRKLCTVVLDWAGLIVEREAVLANKDITKVRVSELTSFVQRVKELIAGPLQCSVWVVHQLSGEATNKAPHVPAHHSQAHWCRSFANNAVYAMCLGVQDNETRVMTFNCSKSRRSRKIAPKLIQINDALRFIDVSDQYIVDRIYGILRRSVTI